MEESEHQAGSTSRRVGQVWFMWAVIVALLIAVLVMQKRLLDEVLVAQNEAFNAGSGQASSSDISQLGSDIRQLRHELLGSPSPTPTSGVATKRSSEQSQPAP